MNIPLAERMRPNSLDDFVGQDHLIGNNKPLRNSIKNGLIPSIIFWGPPGVGKTTLSSIIAKELKCSFYSLSAIQCGVKEIREVLDKAKNTNFFGSNKPILFIDEIHRFSKSQQDSLLGAVEKGIVTLIGATTENPSFEVNSALLSRCQVYMLVPYNENDLKKIIHNALEKDNFLKSKEISVVEYDALFRISGGDARKLLNALEISVTSLWHENSILIGNQVVSDVMQKNLLRYDKSGEQHYDIVSAFIKSIRGSDPNAAVYWLARMIEGGEEPSFICRRMLILASEDIGNANPTAMVIANNCFQAVNAVGMPEARIVLSQCAIYLASSAKSNSSYVAINSAQEEVHRSGNLPVPLHLRNSPTRLMQEFGYGKNYNYSHDNPGNFVDQEYLPDDLQGKKFYEPGNNTREEEIRRFLKNNWNQKYRY